MIILDLVWFHIGALVAVFMPTVCLRALRHWKGGGGECMLQMGRSSAIQTRLSNGTADRGIWEKAARSTEQLPRPNILLTSGFRSNNSTTPTFEAWPCSVRFLSWLIFKWKQYNEQQVQWQSVARRPCCSNMRKLLPLKHVLNSWPDMLHLYSVLQLFYNNFDHLLQSLCIISGIPMTFLQFKLFGILSSEFISPNVLRELSTFSVTRRTRSDSRYSLTER